jgi:hypothetical protein
MPVTSDAGRNDAVPRRSTLALDVMNSPPKGHHRLALLLVGWVVFALPLVVMVTAAILIMPRLPDSLTLRVLAGMLLLVALCFVWSFIAMRIPLSLIPTRDYFSSRRNRAAK